MNLFSILSNDAVQLSKRILKNYRRGYVGTSEARSALKVLASAKILYRRNNDIDANRLESYFWHVNGHIENIYGESDELPDLSSMRYTLIKSSECDYIDLSL